MRGFSRTFFRDLRVRWWAFRTDLQLSVEQAIRFLLLTSVCFKAIVVFFSIDDHGLRDSFFKYNSHRLINKPVVMIKLCDKQQDMVTIVRAL